MTFATRISRLETATNKACDRGCVKCLLASLPIVHDRGASVTVTDRACDGNPMSLTEILQEIAR